MLKPLEIILLAIGLMVACGLAWLNASTIYAKANIAFQNHVEDDVRRLDLRMQKYLQALIATRAFMHRSPDTSNAEFDAFVKDLRIQETLPGINGIGMIDVVKQQDIPTFEAQARADGHPTFSIFPETDHPEKFVIFRISPEVGNEEAIGLDIGFEQHRREAAMRARATNRAQLTAPITLVQDDRKEAGFLLLIPLNDPNRDAWIYAPFVARELLGYFEPLRAPNYIMQVYDNSAQLSPDPIFTSTQRYNAKILAENPVTGRYQDVQYVNHFGRNWTLVFSSTARFDANYNHLFTLVILLGSMLLTVCLIAVLRNFRLRNTALEQVAQLRDRQIEAQESANRSVIENAVTPVLILDGAGVILFANQAACECFGYSERQIRALDFAALVTSHDGDHSYHIGHTRLGAQLILDLQQNAWTTEAGAKRTTAIVRDVTEERNAQQAIMHTKNQFDMALNGSRIGVFDLDLLTGKSVVSDTWNMIMQHDPADYSEDPQQSFMSRVHPDDIAELKAADAACIAGETARSISEFRLKMPDGQWRWMKSDAIVSKRAPDGRALRLLGTQVDVTEVHHARNALEASESLLRQVLSAAPVGTVVLDQSGNFISSNAAFCQLVGVAEDSLNQRYTIHDFLHAKDVSTITRIMTERTNAGLKEAHIADYPLLSAKGDQRIGQFHISTTFNKNSKQTIYISQIIDITEQRRLERLKDEFVSTVSHELRTPLTSIKGALGLLGSMRAKGDTAAADRLVEIAVSNAERLAAIVNNILDLEKISSGDLAFDLDTVNLSLLIDQAAVGLEPFAQSHRNTIEVALPDDAMVVTADSLRTQQVLENLISNACKYSFQDTEVMVKARYDDDMAVVTVTNTGDGVPADFRDHIFDAFSQADGSDTRAKGGTGLGLNISKQIVKQQGGEIGYETTKGGDTVFWFSCPLAKQTKAPSTPKKDPAPDIKGNRPLVLHLEDDADFAEVIRAGLAPHVDVVHAFDMVSAKAILSEMELDAIILDWGLPDGDASKMLGRMRLLQPRARIIGLTADADRKRDPRVAVNIVKTRTDDMPDILAAILDQTVERPQRPV